MNSDKVINATSPAGEGGLPELLADLDKYLEGCPPLTTKPAWMVKKSSRLLLRCRDVIRLLATAEQPGSSVQGEAVGYVCKGGSVEWYSVDGFCLMPKPGTVLHTPPPAPLPNAEEGDFDCPKAAASRSCRCGFCVALRQRTPTAAQPEYFPDGSDSPIRDEARGVEGMAVAYKCPTCGAPASKTEREGVYDMHDVYTYAPSAPEPVRVDGRMTPYMAKQWLDELMGDHDFTLPTDAYTNLVAALAGKDGA